MNTLEIKSNFHKLIDNLNDDSLLLRFYEIMTLAKNQTDGNLWSKLTIEEKEELLEIEKQSRDSENLISHSEIVKKHKKWL
ncbi:MAG: hypothetical protein IPI46_04420 [Bacteroidetes bacterium]|nr:hypothetical protein [Bacteroidota bacterium]